MVDSSWQRSVGGVVVIGEDLVEGPDCRVCGDNVSGGDNIFEAISAQRLVGCWRGIEMFLLFCHLPAFVSVTTSDKYRLILQTLGCFCALY